MLFGVLERQQTEQLLSTQLEEDGDLIATETEVSTARNGHAKEEMTVVLKTEERETWSTKVGKETETETTFYSSGRLPTLCHWLCCRPR